MMEKWIAGLWLILAMGQCTPQVPPLTELRGVRIRPPDDKGRLTAVIDSCYRAGSNVIFLETWYASYAIYPSRVADQMPAFKGWDPLRVALVESHRRGMQAHAVMQVFSAFNPGRMGEMHSSLLAAHPDWRNRPPDPSDLGAEDGKIFLNPAHPQVRKFMRDLVTEMCRDYTIDGLLFDDMRYPIDEKGRRPFGYDPLSVARMQTENGVNPWLLTRDQSNRWRVFVEWKSRQVTETVEELAQEARAQRAGIRISAAVIPDYFSDPLRDRTCQDWQKWVQGGVLDFIVPICDAGNDSLRRIQMQEAKRLSKVPVAISYLDGQRADSAFVSRYRDEASEAGAAGIIWLAPGPGRADLFRMLKRDFYREPAKPF